MRYKSDTFFFDPLFLRGKKGAMTRHIPFLAMIFFPLLREKERVLNEETFTVSETTLV